jgi:hypothetical protein
MIQDKDISDNVNTTIDQIIANVLPNNCFGPNPFIENITKCLQKYISSFEETFKFHLLLYILEFYFVKNPIKGTAEVVSTKEIDAVPSIKPSQKKNARKQVSKSKNTTPGRNDNSRLTQIANTTGDIVNATAKAALEVVKHQSGGEPGDNAVVESTKKCYITGRVQTELAKYKTTSSMNTKKIISDINYIIHSHVDRISKQLLTESELKKTLSNVQFAYSNRLIQNIIANQRFLLEKEDEQNLLVRILYKTKQFFKSLAKSIAYYLKTLDETKMCLFNLMGDIKIRRIIKAIAKTETKKESDDEYSLTKNYKSIFTAETDQEFTKLFNDKTYTFLKLHTALKKTRILSIKPVVVMPRIFRNIQKIVNDVSVSFSGKSGGKYIPEPITRIVNSAAEKTKKILKSPLLTDPRSPANKHMNDILVNATDGIVKKITDDVNKKMDTGKFNNQEKGIIGAIMKKIQDETTYSDEKEALRVSLILCVLKTFNRTFIEYLRIRLPENNLPEITQKTESITYEDIDVYASIYDIIIQQTDKALNKPQNIEKLTESVKTQYMSFIPSISYPDQDDSYKNFFDTAQKSGPIRQAFYHTIRMLAKPTGGQTGGRPNRSASRKTRKKNKRNATYRIRTLKRGTRVGV